MESSTTSSAAQVSRLGDLKEFNFQTPEANSKGDGVKIIDLSKDTSYSSSYFKISSGKLLLSCPFYGATTPGSKCPRSELRSKVEFPMSKGSHSLTATMTVKKVVNDYKISIM